MAKFNIFDMFKRKGKSDTSNDSEKKQKTIEEMNFDELRELYLQIKIDEILLHDKEAKADEEQKLKHEEQKVEVCSRIRKLIKDKDPKAVAYVDKLIKRYVANYYTLKNLKQIRSELIELKSRITELELKEFIYEEKLTEIEAKELSALKEKEDIIEKKLEAVEMQISSLEYENADKMVTILTFEIESPELDKIQKEEDAEAEAEVLKFLEENGIDIGDGSSGASNGDGGIQPGE